MGSKGYRDGPGDPHLETLEQRLLMAANPLRGATSADGALPAPAIEEETDTARNDEPASAQALVFRDLVPGGPQRAAVTGTADGVGASAAYAQVVTIYGYITGANVYRASLPDAIAPGGAGVLAISAKADLLGPDKYISVDAEGLDLGRLFVDDGLSGTKVTAQVALTQAQLAVLAADGVIDLTFTPSAAVARTTMGLLGAQLAYEGAGGAGSSDYYRLDLAAGESASVVAAGGDGAMLEMELVDESGAVVAQGAQDAEGRLVIPQYAAQQGTTLYVRLAGEGAYTLEANRNAMAEFEDNGALDAAQIIAGPYVQNRQWVAGSVTGTDGDFFSIDAAMHDKLTFQAYAPGGGAAAVTLRLYDPAGRLVLQSRSGVLKYAVPRTAEGTYTVQVASADGAQTSYVLGVLHDPWRGRDRRTKAKSIFSQALDPLANRLRQLQRRMLADLVTRAAVRLRDL